MVRSYVVAFIRTLRREFGYAAINIGGLAAGLAACLVIGVYVAHELSYDRFHEKADRIYRVNMIMENSNTRVWPTALLPLGPLLEAEYPEVQRSLRVTPEPHALVQTHLLRAREDRFFYVEPSLFDLFDFQVVEGDVSSALSRPFTVAITPDAAIRYFGDTQPIGKELLLNNQATFEVVAIIDAAPKTSHLQFDFLASFASAAALGRHDNEWSRLAYTYVLLRAGHQADDLNDNLAEFATNYVHPKLGGAGEITLFPLTDIHLKSGKDIQAQGDIRYIYLFSAIALLILLMAGINYVNLATARSARRAKEVGVRKVVGARRRQLVMQFIGESIACVLAALPVAVVFALLLLPHFGELVQRPLEIPFSLELALVLIAVAAVVGVLAGSYPALVLSYHKPAAVLKGQGHVRGGKMLRKGLVTFQFAASVALIACTIVIYQQLRFVQASRLGFDAERLLVIETQDKLNENATAFKEELLRLTGVERVSLAYTLPGRDFAVSSVESATVEDYTPPDGEDTITLNSTWIDHDFIETLGLDLIAGRNFSPELPSDEDESVIINEATQRYFGWKEAIGKKLNGRTVIGVVRDFHLGSFRESIQPTILLPSSSAATRAIVKLRPNALPRTLKSLEKLWRSFVPSLPFEYTFLDEDFAAMYRAEERLGRLFLGFSGLAIIVACLGLFGLAAFTAQSRTKEIGIRKVLGASSARIVALLTGEFVSIVAIAIVVAAPIAYLVTRKWLEGFAYHIELGPGVFTSAAILTITIALLSVSSQALRAALADPADSLRYE